MIGEFDETAKFVHRFFRTFGSCFGYCEICKKSHPACDGYQFNEKGKCPKNCDGSDDDKMLITNDLQGRQVGECCFEKVFHPIKDFLDESRENILEYYAECLKKEREELTATEELLKKTIENK